MLTGCMPSGTRALLDGDQLIRERKYSEAIEKLKKATSSAPEPARPKAWNLLGLAYHSAGRPAEAVAAYQKAIQANANFPAPHYNLGCLYLEQNNWQSALSHLSTFTLLERAQAAGWLKLGTAQLRGLQLDAAERSFQNALQINTNSAEALNGLAIVQLQRKRLPQSIDLFNAALRQKPDYGPALLNLAVIAQHYFTNLPGALQRYRSYLLTQPSPSQAQAVQKLIKQLEAELAPPALASEIPTAPTVSTPTPPAAVSQSSPPPAVAKNDATPAPKPVSVPAPAHSATSATQAVELASSARPAIATSNPNAQSASEVELTRAKPALDPTTTSGPNRVPAPIRPEPPEKVQTVQISEDAIPTNGQPILTNAIRVSGGETHAEMADAGARANATSQTNSIAGGLLIHHAKERPGIGQRLNPMNWLRGRDKDSEARVTSGDSPAPNASDDLPAKPMAASKPAPVVVPPKPAASRADFPRYRHLAPGRPEPGDRRAAEPFFSQGLRAHKERRLAAAIEAYQKAIELDPAYYEAHYNIGLAAYDLRDASRSLVAYERALAIRPDSLDARFNFALSLQRANHVLDAAAELERALIDYPEEPRLHFTLGKIYAEQLNDHEAARRHYRRVLELDPQHSNAIGIRYWLVEHP